MDPEECEMLAGRSPITVVPSCSLDTVQLIGGPVGPLEAGVPTRLPLWVALHLRRRHKCVIVAPDWMNVDELKAVVLAENDTPGLTRLPSSVFFETVYMLVRDAHSDIENVDQIKNLVQDLWERRSAKLRTTTLIFLQQKEHCHARMDNISQLEVAFLRPALCAAARNIDTLVFNLHSISTD